MTREEAINELESLKTVAIYGCTDVERAHRQADEILLRFLRDAGYCEVADSWESLENAVGGFWYG